VSSKNNNFIQRIISFKDEQKKQKLNGVNDYNMLNIVRSEFSEVGMHSNVIYSLLNPDGLHYQGDLFLKLFIKNVLKIEDFGTILFVEAEEATNKNRRIDFTIKSDKYYIGIEMKINASDLDEQISHYYDDLQKKAINGLNQKVILYYLTIDGKDANSYSHKNIKYEKISFKTHILDWIEKCQKEIIDIPNLFYSLENYKNIVKKITNQFKSNIQTFDEFFTKDFENLINFTKNHDELIKNINYIEELNSGYEKALDTIYSRYAKKLIESLFIENDYLDFMLYDRENSFILLKCYDYFELRIYTAKNNMVDFKSIGIAPAWRSLSYQGNYDLTSKLEEINTFLENNIILKDYKIGKQKGIKLENSKLNNIPTLEDVFYCNFSKSLNLEEINKHIEIINNQLKSL
jgi:hypothetical protein